MFNNDFEAIKHNFVHGVESNAEAYKIKCNNEFEATKKHKFVQFR